MSSNHSDGLIKLIQTLTKAEKRSFKLYATRNSASSDDLKFLQLFDFIEKNAGYTDELALQRLKDLKKSQLSNIKAHLFRQILTSLRLQHLSRRIDSEIRESIDHAQILYQKGFYNLALRILDRAKQNARRVHADLLTLEIVEFEKIIESQYITRSISSRADELTRESQSLQQHVSGIVTYSNIALQLYSLYLKVGFVRDEKDFMFVREFFHSKLPAVAPGKLGVEERMHLYNAHVRYNHMIQDFVMCYKYAKLWVNLFEVYPVLAEQSRELYLKGVHNLLTALFNLRSYKRFVAELGHLEAIKLSDRDNENVVLLHKLYVFTNQINLHYLEGRFSDGLVLVPQIEAFIVQYEGKLDMHRELVFYFKIACLYFGSGDNRNAIVYLNRIIQMKEQSIREDIQGFARILSLIAHFELGNEDLIEYQVKSVYRYLSNLADLQGQSNSPIGSVQQEIIRFLRQLPIVNPVELQRAFRQLLSKLTKLSQSPYEKRPFLYLDIISWLECKIAGKTVQEVVRRKFELELQTGVKGYFPE